MSYDPDANWAIDTDGAPTITFGYTNHAGVDDTRKATPLSIWFGSTKWHPEPQWFLRAICHDRNDIRDFAMKDMSGVR